MNCRPKLHMLCISLIIMSIGVAGSQTSSTTSRVVTGVISESSDTVGAVVENRDNPTSSQAIKDYAIGAAGDAVEAGAVAVTKEVITKGIINKGAEAYVAARAAGDYAAAEAIKAATIEEATAAGVAFSTGAFIAAVAAAVVVGLAIPAYTDPDPCDIDPSKCGPNQPPATPAPDSISRLGTFATIEEDAINMYDTAASYEPPPRIVNEQNSGSSKSENWDASAGGFNGGQFPRVYA